MLKYAKITNEETKECSVGIGTDTEFYKSIGMVEMDVEEAYNGTWYVKGYAPEKPAPTTEEIRQQREAYYKEHCDPLTCEKIRKMAIFEWEEEDEEEYVNRMKDIKALVDQLYPYNTEE